MEVTERLDKAQVQKIRYALEEALSAAAKDLGLTASGLGNISYDDKTLTTGRITFALESTQESFDNLEDYIGKRYKHNRRIFTIEGIAEGKLRGRTQHGKVYLIKKDQLDTMIQL